MTSRIWPEPLKEWICHNWDGKDYRSWGSQVGRDQELISITILLKSLWVTGRDVKQAVVYVSLKFKRELWLQACISKSSLHAWHLEPLGWISSVQFSRSVVSDSLQPHESQHTRPPCPSATPGVYSNSSPSSRWCHPAISSSVVPFSSCPQSLAASGYLTMSQLFAWGGQSTGVSASASVLPMNTQDWIPLGLTGWISL